MDTPNPANDVQTLVFQIVELQTYGIVDTFTIQVREGSVYYFWAPQYVGGLKSNLPDNRHPALKDFAAALQNIPVEGPLHPVQTKDAIHEASRPLVDKANESLAVDSLRIV